MVRNKSFSKCDRCHKEFFTWVGSKYCYRCMVYFGNKKLREYRKKNKLCIECGTKTKPITYYPVRCTKCSERKSRNYKIVRNI